MGEREKEEGRAGEREGGRLGGRERERARECGREGGRERESEGGREKEREGERERERREGGRDGELDFSGSSTRESPSLPVIMPPVCGVNLSEP